MHAELLPRLHVRKSEVMKRLKLWLTEHNISIVRPRLGSGGLITLRLHPPYGADFEVDFLPDDLEADPESAIRFIERYLAGRHLSL
jgi:hypothetical protein